MTPTQHTDHQIQVADPGRPDTDARDAWSDAPRGVGGHGLDDELVPAFLPTPSAVTTARFGTFGTARSDG